mmetsp:Transcript_4370/g.9788  ORF Transcript_4370/g.9788 Transcript_4370/m.9788 type:complete len:398 (+) Transcript_4370:236-1429(+)
MANVTDPLARSVHGTNPQNLIEYITRQKIYDSLYWKEECFGLSASDVATKASELKALGGSYGGNNKPTRFLCLALKLLQIQPEEGIVEEFLQNEDFKYVRALGAFYLRLTGRPAEIYELVEPLCNDFRKLRFRDPTGWKITYMDELADELLTTDRYCGIALPHLPKRDVLVSAGYLDGPRRSALTPLVEEQAGGDAEIFLQKLADEGNVAAKAAMDERSRRKAEAEEKERIILEQRGKISDKQSECNNEGGGFGRYESRDYHRPKRFERVGEFRDRDQKNIHENRGYYGDSRGYPDDGHNGRSRDFHPDRQLDDEGNQRHRSQHKTRDERQKEKKSSKRDKKYGSLFKKSSNADRDDDEQSKSENPAEGGNDSNAFEGSEDYWNAERAKLGLKPLKD